MVANTPVQFINGQAKVSKRHLQGLAYIYIRQSTPGQVAHHQESQRNQEKMAERARALGWTPTRIRILKTDLGVSGQYHDQRAGFRELLGEVSLGQVGIIFSYEVSRLARNNSDWYRLLEAAAVFDTLIADYDGIYDLHLFNDRLLLGLKGTMSEAELHLLKLRLEGGRRRQLERGVYRQGLPTGLVRLPEDHVVKDPDEQVQHTIGLVFIKFKELGTCSRVMAYLCDQNILLPRKQMSGRHKGQVIWKPAAYSAVYAFITNPAYAGALVYGRKQVDHQRVPHTNGHLLRGGRTLKPMDEWHYIHHDVYPAYISWQEYLGNREQLHRNQMRLFSAADSAQGAAREGAALLQGMVVCGQCGHRMTSVYKPWPRYTCQSLKSRFGQASCAFLNAPAVNRVVVQAFFNAIQPAQLNALETVLKDQTAEQARLLQQWQDRLKRAQYEAHLAERQYNAVDPDNRLVATELERRWEAALRQLEETRDAYDRFQQTAPDTKLSPEFREQFRHITDTLPDLWDTLPNQHKKALLRSLISRVILTRLAPDKIEVKVVWVSGHYSVCYTRPPIRRNADVTGYDQMVRCIYQLYQQNVNDEDIAARLTAEGFHSARSPIVSSSTVQKIRTQHGWYRPSSQPVTAIDGYLKIAELAERLDVKPMWIYRQVRNQTIDPVFVSQHPHRKVILIRDDPNVMEALRQ